MSGLLLKDFYMIRKYFKSYLLLLVCFLALSVTNSENMFFIFYPCLLCGLLPMNLLSFDEKSRWNTYCGSLPYTKGQIVSAKFLVGIIMQAVVLVSSGITHAIRMIVKNQFVLSEYFGLMLMLFAVSAITSSVSMPFVFKYGAEKGRLFNYVVIGIVCAVSGALTGLIKADVVMPDFSLSMVFAALCIMGIGVYTVSWLLSIRFYRKREIA